MVRRPRSFRILALALLALALAPGTWLRTDPAADSRDLVTLHRVGTRMPATSAGFTREGLWQLRSPHADFGGYSAMLALGDDVLRLFSDRGTGLTFYRPGAGTDLPALPRHFFTVWDVGPFSQNYPDIESATQDPVTGDYWLGYEYFNAVVRYDLGSTFIAARQPEDMQAWPINGGAEAMARLADGRFVLLPENDGRGLLYPSDPTQGARALAFRFDLPEPYYATDMAALPDGRVLILARGLDWHLLPFTAQLWIGDPAAIRAGKAWTLQRLVQLDTLLPRENYEAMALVPQADGSVIIWLASDDNLAVAQRTLLARLSWNPAPE